MEALARMNRLDLVTEVTEDVHIYETALDLWNRLFTAVLDGVRTDDLIAEADDFLALPGVLSIWAL